MSTEVRKRVHSDGGRVAFRATWDEYQALAQTVGDQQVRIAYDGDKVELMSPGPRHEFLKVLLELLVRTLASELNISRLGMGATHWERPAAWRGLEADATFYLTPEKIAVAMRRPENKADYPIPDLAIEIDLSPSKIDRAGIYAALVVTEVWRYDDETLRIDRLGPDGTYHSVTESGFLGVRTDEVVNLLSSEARDEADFVRIVTDWARHVLLPRRAGGQPGANGV